MTTEAPGSPVSDPTQTTEPAIEEASEALAEASEAAKTASSEPVDDGYEPLTKFDRDRLLANPNWRPKGWKPEAKGEKTAREKVSEALGEDVQAPEGEEKPEGEEPEVKADPPGQEGLHEVIINGKKQMKTIEELKKGYQIGAASSEKFEEASKVKKQLVDLVELMKTDPIEVLKHPALGHDVRKLVEDWLYGQIQYDNMDPKEKELIDVKNELKITRQKEEQTKKEAQNREIESYRTHYAKQYQGEIQEAMETSGLPKTPETVSRLVYYLKKGLAKNVRLKATDVVDLVRDDYMKSAKAMFGSADAETLVKMFGQDFIKKVQKHEAKKLKDTGKTPKIQPPSDGRVRGKKPLTKDEWKARIAKRANS